MKARNPLGQNFLTSKKVAHDAVSSARLNTGDVVLEVGPGRGFLTEELLKHAGRVIAVEKDKKLVLFLGDKFKEDIKNGKLDLIDGDILKIISSREFTLLKDGRRGKSSRESGSRGAESLNLKANSYKLVANIPYYLTSHLITELLRGGRAPSLMVLMVQKEVAERIVAGEGKENILSLAVKFYGVPKIIRFVKSGSFSPPPKVGSALLLIDNIKNREGVREKEFFNLIHAGFSHKRKLLVRNLEGGNWAADKVEVFKKCGIGERTRAEDLTLDDWLCLYNFYPHN